MVDAECQPLEVRKDPVDPREKRMGGHGADDLRHVIAVAHSGVGREAVGQDRRAVDRVVGHKPLQRRRGVVLDRGQPDAGRPCRRAAFRPRQRSVSCPRRCGLGRQRRGRPWSGTRWCFRRPRPSLQVARARGRPSLGATCAATARRSCMSRCRASPEAAARISVRVRSDQMRREKPRARRQVGPVHHGASRGRGLSAAASTLPSPRLGFKLPAFQTVASWAHEAVRPAAVRQPFGARGVVRERRHELLQRRRTVMLPAADLGTRCHFDRVAGR
jgi:hypothetical protein